jgi:molybdopterin molybdotransferase
VAQLSNDCFAAGEELLKVHDAERLIASRVTALKETEQVGLDQAQGRCLAADLVAPISLPVFDNSAIDGFAVHHGNLESGRETRLTVGQAIFAGQRDAAPVTRGEAARIFTGAPMPPGSDTVFMQEDCRVEAGDVIVPSGLKRGANVRYAGEDIAAGAVALDEGRMLGVREIALAAALGISTLTVRRRTRVALFSTGDELVEPGRPLGAAQLYDANRAMIAALLRTHGADITDLGILGDEPEALSRALQAAAAGHDLILTSGGVSLGDADFVRSAVERIGHLVFWRMAIKPGRPVALGVITAADGTHNAAFAGLPGNPVAVFVTFAHVVRPLLMQLAGARHAPLMTFPVRAAFDYKKKPGRREYVRVALRTATDGMPEAVKYAQDGAGVITSLTRTDGLAILPEEMANVRAGMMIAFSPYAAMMGTG